MKTYYVIAANEDAARKVAGMIHRKQIPHIYRSAGDVMAAWSRQPGIMRGAYNPYRAEISESPESFSAFLFNLTATGAATQAREASGYIAA